MDLSPENTEIKGSQLHPTKTSSLGVFERLTAKIECKHDHDQCPNSKKTRDLSKISRWRRPSKSLNSSPLNKDKKNKHTTFSKLLDSTNFEVDDKKNASLMSINQEENEQLANALEELNVNSHKDYLIGKLCEKLRKLNVENKSLCTRLEKLEHKHYELAKNHNKTCERFEKEFESITKETKETSIIKHETSNETAQTLENKNEKNNKDNSIQKQERSVFEKNDGYEDLIYKIKVLETERNKYYEQLMTVQKKNEAFFIENSELFKTNQKLINENENLQSKIKVIESTASIKKKSSPIFKSVFTNESTIETEDEMIRHSPNDEIIKEVIIS